MLSRAARFLAAIAIAASAAACAQAITVQGASACGWERSQPSQQSAAGSGTVVLIDSSASFWPKKNGQVSVPDDAVSLAVTALLRNFQSSGTRLVSFGTFDGSSATVNWQLSQVALPTPTGDGNEVQAEQQSAAKCLTGFVKNVLNSSAPRAPGTDVMAALAAAAQQLQGTPSSADQVVLITDGLSNTGCLNLSDVISRGKAASAVLAACPEHADLARLRGVSLQLNGIGFQAAQPPLSTAEQAWVAGYWRDVCAALGVAAPNLCVAAQGNTVTRGSAVTRLPDPGIVFPAVRKGAPSVLVPADLLFAFGSSRLSAAGQAYLTLLAQQIRAQGRAITKIVGHTDAVGTAEYNLGLSRRRAQAVGGYLAQRGFKGVTAIGAGESGPACSPQYDSAGAPIESCMARDRRVQIFLGG